jgi:hypothetical protein
MSDDGLDELRRDLAAERGLDEAAVQFIGGTTVAEVEASADALASLLASHRTEEREQAEPLTGLFADASSAKAARKHALIEALDGRRSEQARDERGGSSAASTAVLERTARHGSLSRTTRGCPA